jgi:transcriptional regulator with XRE-family HTH domain
MSNVGARIRSARKQKRMSQDALGALVGVTRVAVSEWERGLSLPRVATAQRISNILDLPESSLTPLGSGGLKMLDARDKGAHIAQIDWADIPGLWGKQITMRDQASEFIAVEPESFRLEIVDNSMLPVFAPGDAITVDQTENPWDGCQVIAVDPVTGIGSLRNYRRRQFGGVDLWANNSAYPTDTIADDARGRIVGVVVMHERRINRPSA